MRLLTLLALTSCATAPDPGDAVVHQADSSTSPTTATGPTSPTTGGATLDADGDGFTTAEGDCDDSDPSIFPGSPERVLHGRVLVESQGQLAALTCVQRIMGTLEIRTPEPEGDRVARVHDLSPLRALESVAGLTIRNVPVTSLDGLDALTHVGMRGLHLSEMHDLRDIDALRGLTRVAGDVVIDRNRRLEDLYGLRDLYYVGGDLRIRGNNQLRSTYGLSNVETVLGGLLIGDNPRITSGSLGLGIIGRLTYLVIQRNGQLRGLGLGSVAGVDGDVIVLENSQLRALDLPSLDRLTKLQIEGNPSLATLSGLAGLTAVEGDLQIVDNDALAGLEGLESLTRVTGDLEIVDNDALLELDALSGVRSTVADLRIADNDALLDLAGLSGITGATGWVDVDHNPSLVALGGGLDALRGHVPWLRFQGNDALQTIDGLSGVTSVVVLDIQQNDSLERIDGLTRLETVEDFLQLAGLPQLTELSGLGALTAAGLQPRGTYSYTGSGSPSYGFGGGVLMQDLPALTHLRGLASLRLVGGDLALNSSGLLTLDGLQQLRTVEGALSVSRNPSLVDIQGLGVQHVGRVVQIQRNRQLCRSQVTDFYTGLSTAGSLRAWGNDPGC